MSAPKRKKPYDAGYAFGLVYNGLPHALIRKARLGSFEASGEFRNGNNEARQERSLPPIAEPGSGDFRYGPWWQ